MKITEQGVALITALLVVALATVSAVSMTTRQQFDIHRTANLLNTEQAYRYTLGGESWAMRILARDNREIDNLKEMWSLRLPPLPIPGGTLQGNIEDLQGRFNLNNLVLEGKPSAVDVTRFERLLKIMELPTGLAQVAIDWIDSDKDTQFPNGAEDNMYLAQTPAYRTANTLLSHPSELRLLSGVTKEIYQKLLPYICVLPTRTAININTASAPVLLALAENISEISIETLLKDRDKKPFPSVQDFLAHSALAGLTVETAGIGVTSDYFLVTTQVQIEGGQAQLSSVIHRLPDKLQVVMRSQGEQE